MENPFYCYPLNAENWPFASKLSAVIPLADTIGQQV
jgi:hypothetical protein